MRLLTSSNELSFTSDPELKGSSRCHAMLYEIFNTHDPGASDSHCLMWAMGKDKLQVNHPSSLFCCLSYHPRM